MLVKIEEIKLVVKTLEEATTLEKALAHRGWSVKYVVTNVIRMGGRAERELSVLAQFGLGDYDQIPSFLADVVAVLPELELDGHSIRRSPRPERPKK